LLLAVCAVAACGRAPLTLPTSTATGGGSSGTGGDLGSGGATSTGGITGSGGSTGRGSGGDGGSGGATSTGGTAGSGGSTSSGGATTSTGGATHSAGSGGNGGLGGATATGGTKANGGSTGSGGVGGGTAGMTATGGTKANGGSTGSSSSGGAGGASCSNVQPCGGDVVGTWTVTSSCLEVTGKLDMSVFGLGCAPAPVTGSLRVTGTWIAKSNGTYADNTTTTGSETFTLAASCLQISGTTITCDGVGVLFQSEYQSVSCTPAAGGGCTCAATVNQTNWAGVVSFDASTSGTYKTAGNVVTLDDEAKYSYCVSGSKMTWTPQSTSPTTTGTIVFQK
jgi:hypothetical protein